MNTMPACLSPYELPCRDELGFCNVLLSALGGDGANVAAKLLFRFGCEHFGLDGGYDARFGSEEKGTATDACIRFCEPGTPVRQSGPTDRPHILVVFHDDLIEPLALHQGLHANATCIVNTTRSPARMRGTLRLASGRVVCVDATRIARDSGSYLNMPLLALLCHELRFPDSLIREVVARQWPRAAEPNLTAYTGALEGAVAETFSNDGTFSRVPPSLTRGPVGYLNLLNGGAIDARTHCTIGRDNRIASRGRIPRFD